MNAQVDLDALLSEVVADSSPSRSPPQWPSGAARGIQKVTYTQDAMINLILANPAISQNQLAAHFGYTASWISQVIASDAFQQKLKERAAELIDPSILESIDNQFKGLVSRSLDILREKLNRPTNDIPDQLALRTLELSSRALGYGARAETLQRTEVNVEVHLEEMGSNLVKLLQRKKAEAESPIDAEICQEVSDEK